MEQEIVGFYRAVCCTCLSSDRNLIALNTTADINQILRLILYDYAGDSLVTTNPELQQLVCFECLALLKKFARFKKQAQTAQEHLRVLALQGQESLDHTYMSQSLSPLVSVTRTDYDKIFFNYTSGNTEPANATVWYETYGAFAEEKTADNVKDEHFGIGQNVHDNIILEDGIAYEEQIMGLETTNIMPLSGSILVPVSSNTYTIEDKEQIAVQVPSLEVVSQINDNKLETVITQSKESSVKDEKKNGYVTYYMTEEEMLICREDAKTKLQYATAVFKCELCIVGFYAQQQVEDHFMALHRSKPGRTACRVCFVYVEDSKLQAHVDKHYTRYVCNICGHIEYNNVTMKNHVKAHYSTTKLSPGSINMGDTKRRRKNPLEEEAKPGNLRRLLSKTVIEGYQCLECDMFFKTSRARKNHVMRFHREGLQCDHCLKRFVNKTTLATHIKLHEGPLPREECPICHKMVRSVQLKYHIRRHQSTERFKCDECEKIFSHLATYQAHLKYSRAHATENVFKYPCPMCNKGYPTKSQMQDHFNYQHLGKTSHKCPVCDKPIASKANVEKHVMRVHGKKKEKPRNHVCNVCRKGFTDKKSLSQHEVIHSGARPLSCDICQQTFKQKASLYTHRKRVHKIYPAKKQVEFMEIKAEAS